MTLNDYNFVESILDGLQVYIFAKDLKGRFIFVNENFARVSGMDSKEQLIGKRDADVIWGDQYEYFRNSDIKAMRGNSYENVPELLLAKGGAKEIITTKNALKNSKHETAGVIGSFIECEGKALVKRLGKFDPSKKRIYLGQQFCNAYLTLKEFEVYYYILQGKSASQISSIVNRSRRTVEFHLIQIKSKMQCSTHGELIATAITTGLTHTLFNSMSYIREMNALS